ncbi:LOB domain-containing protein 40-like [Diospyros lotus]|uniref:LOB domain-containing protein 40-like n=1 Tax=Diospyros lotus TaxID=55363 RepID=UPI00224EF387|nr:LOB domain-containing protein 40-like [Diospyros lotus]
MKMSCNGCRVLRKGCTERCTLRPCLEWINCPEAEANATVFLAKFYGRAGLFNLINAGPPHLRPSIFKSLLYEACGRIINPIHGSVGLWWSSNWHCCEAAVQAVLSGSPIIPIPADDAAAAAHPMMPIVDSDIRHLNKDPRSENQRAHVQPRFKRTGGRGRSRSQQDTVAEFAAEPGRFSFSGSGSSHSEGLNQFYASGSQDDSMLSESQAEESQADLELSLGFNPVWRIPRSNGGGSDGF